MARTILGQFRHLNPHSSEVLLSQEYKRSLKSVSADDGHAILAAVDLADSAVAFYRGMYPLESPYFQWGEALPLPWSNHYWSLEGKYRQPKNLDVQEIGMVLRILGKIEPDGIR